MASSLILTGGAAFTKTLKDTQTQVGHGFAEGDVVRWDNVSQLYVKAKADTAANAEVLGVINAVNGNTFEITYCGLVTLSGLPASISGAPVLFLSSTTSGGLEASPPSALGTVVKPVLTRDKGNNYIVTNYLGTQIGGSSTIAVDEIQPVGTIMPFAGNAIPVTWLACDGSTHDRTEYSELYTKLCFTDGDQVPMYGYVVGITGAAAGYANIAAGDVVHFKKTTSAFAGNAPFDQQSNDEVRAQVLAVPNATVKYLQLSVIPKYSNGKFQFSNTLLGTVTTNSNNYRVFSGTSSTLKTITGFNVTGVQILHFRTPDLRGRFALGDRSVGVPESTNEAESAFISSIGTYTMGSLGGEESHALTSGEMPSHGHDAGTLSTESAGSHTHGITAHWGQGDGGGQEYLAFWSNQDGTRNPTPGEGRYARNEFGAGPYQFNTNPSGNHTHTITGSVAAAGSNTPHNNMPPYLAVRYIIKAKPYTRAAIIDGVEIPYQNLLVRDLRSRSLGGNADADLIICTNKSTDAGLGVERIRVMGTDGSVGIGKTPAAGISLDVNGWAAFSGRVGIGRTDPQVALDVNGQVRSSIALGDFAAAPNSTLTTKEYVNSIVPLALNMNGTTPTLLPFSYTCVGANWTFDENGNYITTGVGNGMFHMPSAGVVLNNISVISGHNYTRNASTYSTAVLPVGTWDICCFMFSNLGPGSETASDDDKFTFYRCYSARLVSTTENRANVVGWLVTRGFGTLVADGSGGIRNYRGHQAGTGFAVRVS